MSIDIKFNKSITLNMLKEKTDFKLEYFSDTKLWVASKVYEFDDVETESSVNGKSVRVKTRPYNEQFVQLILDYDNSFEFSKFNEMSDDDKMSYLHEYNMIRNKKGIGTFDSDGDIPIYEFTTRGNGSLMIREISKIFQAKFITDAEEDELFYLGEEVEDWSDSDWDKWYEDNYSVVMSRYGLMINDGGIIIDNN